jgi:hypothetical protein
MRLPYIDHQSRRRPERAKRRMRRACFQPSSIATPREVSAGKGLDDTCGAAPCPSVDSVPKRCGASPEFSSHKPRYNQATPRADGEDLDWGGRAQQRRRFPPPESGVALRFPPQSKSVSGMRNCLRIRGPENYGLGSTNRLLQNSC